MSRTSAVQHPDAAMYALRSHYHLWLEGSPRVAALHLCWPPLRTAYASSDTWDDQFSALSIEPLRLRHRLNLGAASRFGTVDLLIGSGAERVSEILDRLANRHPEWARLESYGRSGVKVMLRVPAMTAGAGFDPAVASTVLAWFEVLCEWWTVSGARLVPWAVAPTRG